ncbi:MAG: hypothetical protein AAF456_18475 [Planctomycetota bacterium]
MKQLERFMFLLPMLLFSQTALASGWNDYSLNIAPGYEIARCNTFDIGLVDASSAFIYFPERGGKSGPISGYIVSPSHIFLRTTGQRPRNKFAGDTYVYADSSIEYFFVVDRSDNSLVGPLTAAEFSADPYGSTLGNPDWIVPKNPGPERAYAGQLMFLAISAVIFGGPILLVGMLIFVVYRLVRKPKGNAAPGV